MKLTYLGTASVLLDYGGLRIITDPVLDEPGQNYSFGPWYAPKKWFASTRSYAAPLTVDQLGALDVALVSHDHHADNLDTAGRAVVSGNDSSRRRAELPPATLRSGMAPSGLLLV